MAGAKEKVVRVFRRLANSRIAGLLSPANRALTACQIWYFRLKWKLQGAKMPDGADVALMKENVTFIYKSFQRQTMAKQLYRNIQQYYPGVQVIIADDSEQPLQLEDACLQVIQLPFNSGLSYGINRALEQVKTPYVIRMDDDELLTPYTNFHGQLRFLMAHPEVDVAAVGYIPLPRCPSLEQTARQFYAQTMQDAPLPLKIPHLTPVDKTHVVVGKPPNIFIARTESIRSVGYDEKIRMIDHNEFFFRAAGVLVSVFDPTTYVLHRHDRFNKDYEKYRMDVRGDVAYIREKMRKLLKKD